MVITISNELTVNDALKDYVHSENLILRNSVPEACQNGPCRMGIDEAGRGPVLGPMVYGICFHPIAREMDLKEMGCADSKALTESTREDLFNAIQACDDYIGWAVDIISPNFISNCMLRRDKHSLNEVALDSTLRLIRNALNNGAQITEIFVDTVGPPEKYEAKLSSIFPQCNIVVSKKADALYPVVSAASICAKVIRDFTIKHWQFPEGNAVDKYGSGYPNDPETKKFLSENLENIFGFPNFVRFSWSTASKILESRIVNVEWDDADPNDGVDIASFFTQKDKIGKHEMKHSYFQHNNLTNIGNF